MASIDLLPNYGPGTSKRYRKPVTTGNTVIFYCEKRNYRRSSNLSEAKIYLFAVLVIFDMPSTNHFFWSFYSQVGITMVLEGFSGVFVFGLSALLYRDFDNVSDGLDLSKSGWSFLATKENAKKSFSSKLKVYGRKKSRTCQAQIKIHDQSTKVKLLVLKLRHFCILHGSEVTLFHDMPITGVRSNVIEVAQLCAKYVNTASEVKFTHNRAPMKRKIRHHFESLWRPEK